MSHEQMYDILLDLAKQYSMFIYVATSQLCEEYDADIVRLVKQWAAIRHTILCELGIA